MEKPYSGRAHINESTREFTIEIPSRKNWLIIIFMTAWLGAWLIGELSALGIVAGILSGNEQDLASLFVLFWLAAWTIAGFFIIRTLVWMIAGKEIISFSNTELKIHKKAMLLSKVKTYDIKEVKDFAVIPNTSTDNIFGGIDGLKFWNMGNQGSLKFDYGLKTVKLAMGIDEAEAKSLLDKIQSKN